MVENKVAGEPSNAECIELDEKFEHAYFNNSYPSASTRAQRIEKAIKVITVIVLFFETLTSANISTALLQYSQIVTRVDTVVKGGYLAILIPSLVKIVSALHVFTYAKERTDRTPEHRSNTRQFLRVVTTLSIITTGVILALLTLHSEQIGLAE